MKNLINSFLLLAMFGFLFTSCDSDDDNNVGTGPGTETNFSEDADEWTTSVEQGQQTTGANLSVFGWTYAASQAASSIDGLDYDNPSWTISNPQPDETHSGFIDSDETWTNDRVHLLDGKVYVNDGASLTIEAGTLIKGKQSSGSNASALIVSQGGKIFANGTAQQPIIMTSELDNITLGSNAGTNLGVNDNSLWGGLLVLGNARGSFSGDAVSIQIEGLPATEPGDYGGTDDADNSGVINYLSLRHGGAIIGSDNEINGITLGAVGSGTQISNIEVVANKDDGIEWFAGTVDVQNAFVWGCSDDQFDFDEAYSGTLSNAVSVSTNLTDHAMEIDGPAGSYQAAFTIDGLTLIGDTSTVVDGVSGNREYADLRDGALCTIKNVYVYNFRSGSDVELDDADTLENYLNGNVSFENWQVVYPVGDDNTVMWNNTVE
ncbi:hypothetical protein [Psychroflexus planctonicus]|uniref:Uncharacterized protein n=1 Tax=Psychroflexus planctonicus TaxID=1526575 RepID=A0ABQ1SGH5_9FLAO|nr:hypothetical protein [Psychroflexus planctonicus]GGE36924.1 hypothetical protein GCM10010832_16390 [Psychroflexus planctonicus]